VSEVHREAAALKEQQLVLKLEAGKLTRAELLMRQKVRCAAVAASLLLHPYVLYASLPQSGRFINVAPAT
jgi:hypothetical protein